jgi:methyltransferase (TIGR00027 family)
MPVTALKRMNVLFKEVAKLLQHQPSRTAEYMAMFRASEHAKGAGRRVFTDPLAIALLPGSLRLSAKLLALRPVGEVLARYIDRQWPGARTSGIARTRLIDDWIEESIGQSEQVVLLGAGFDTRAWRLAALGSVKVFEVDHPATAKVKRERLQAAGADLNRATFVAVDFEIDDFEQRLGDAGFDPARRTIVSVGRRQPVSDGRGGLRRNALGGPACAPQPVHLHLCS